MEKILVSACLLGEEVRYSGRAATCDDPVLVRWLALHRGRALVRGGGLVPGGVVTY